MEQWLIHHLSKAFSALDLVENNSISSLSVPNYLWMAKTILLNMGSFSTDTLPGYADMMDGVLATTSYTRRMWPSSSTIPTTPTRWRSHRRIWTLQADNRTPRGALRPHPLRQDALGQRVRRIDELSQRQKPRGKLDPADGGSGHPAHQDGVRPDPSGGSAVVGLDWDGEMPPQSARSDAHAGYFHHLEELGLVYPCYCTRSQLHSVNAPHLSDGTYVLPRHLPGSHRCPACRPDP